MPKIVISIPAYNEEHTLPGVIKEIREVMIDYDYEIIVINDGSTDNTAKICDELGVKVYSNPKNMGLAYTFKEEMKRCIENNADVIVHTDADGQYPAKYIPEIITERAFWKYDIVIGSRFEKGKYEGTFIKKLGNIMFAKVFSILLGTTITDTTTGFRCFNKKVAMLPLTTTFTYTQEQLILVGKNKLKIGEIFIETRPTRPSRLFKNPFEYAVKAWINIIKIYWRFYFKK